MAKPTPETTWRLRANPVIKPKFQVHQELLLQENKLFPFLLLLSLLALVSGLGSLMDRRFLGLVVGRTGPMIGGGFLTLAGDGFKLCSKNPWISYIVLLMGFLLLGLEATPLMFLPHSLLPGWIFLTLMGLSSVVTFLSANVIRGYSSLGRSRIRFLLFLGEGIFSFLLLILVTFLSIDGLFMMEQDCALYLSNYALSGLGLSFFIVCTGERHPFDIPESESDLGGGFGVIFSGISFLLLAVLEYRWLIHWIVLCWVFQWTLLSHTISLFVLRGFLPRFSFQALNFVLWWNLPLLVLSWAIVVLLAQSDLSWFLE